ncbi:hypothetical protein ACFRAR_30605 [Kitasatospora sp. NPDC056651]|uniref:NHL domain-containing protein n=1 Tax=Kitasatospora sp. NPDC056651 TaxID=3345892 RepID=UPI0036783A66
MAKTGPGDGVVGIITTVAGGGRYDFNDNGDGGPATQTTFSFPTGVAVDPHGNLYISEWGSSRVRMVSAGDGIITTVAGSGKGGGLGDGGPATRASLYQPRGVAVDARGNLYIADTEKPSGAQGVRRRPDHHHRRGHR